jgi:hypothetical protein
VQHYLSIVFGMVDIGIAGTTGKKAKKGQYRE